MAVRRSTTKIYDNIAPALITPNHFFCNQSSTIVAIYNEPLGKEMDGVTLMFPGDLPTSSPQRVVPQRVGNRTLVFETPVYSASKGMVQVLPLLNLPSGEVELAPFKISIKHPVWNVMELCLKLSSSGAVLPVLIALMVHSVREEVFQDPHIDRIMATLVSSRFPGASTNIKDIILPERKWRNMSLAELAKEFQLHETEKQAYSLKTVLSEYLQSRLKWRKRNQKTATMPEAASHHKGHGGRNGPQYENIAMPILSSKEQRRRSSSDIEISVYPDTKSDVRYRTLSTDRPGGQPISDPEDLRRPIKPHYANFSVLHMSTGSQFAAVFSGSDSPIISENSEKQQLLVPSGASFDRYKSRSVGSGLNTIPTPEMPMRPHGSQGFSYPSDVPIHGTQMQMTARMVDRMNSVDEHCLAESSSEEDRCNTADTHGPHILQRNTTPPYMQSYYSAKTESSQQYPTLSKDNPDLPPKLKRPVPIPRKRKPQSIAGDNYQATSHQQPLDSHHLSNSSSSATKWFESQPTSSQHGIQHQHKSADSMSTSAGGKDETRDSVMFVLM